jgi:HD-like signal output (HDOD) protein
MKNQDNSGASLNGWIEKLKSHDLPVFGRTVQEIMNVSSNQDSSFSELAKVILQDASMTARVLKLANAVHYNPRGYCISTITRAIALMGLEQVRNLSLTIALIDSMGKGANREQLNLELARSIHAATQAKKLTMQSAPGAQEEIFVAALLHHVGELAFWSLADEEGRKLAEALRRGMPKEKAEVAVLGFQLKQLSRGLAKEWRLGKTLMESLEIGTATNSRSQLISLCHELAEATERGWNHGAVKEVQNKLAKLTGMGGAEVVEATQANAMDARRICRHFGAGAGLIKPPAADAETGGESEAAVAEAAEEILRYDPILQLNILRDMTAIGHERPDFNLLLEMALEGIYRGIGMDRALFALVGQGHSEIRAKYVLGVQSQRMLEVFCFPLAEAMPNIFQEALSNQQGIWVGKPGQTFLDLDRAIIRKLGGANFFVMPVMVGGKSFGLFYADRIPSGRSLDQQSFENFEYFALQTSLILGNITPRQKR